MRKKMMRRHSLIKWPISEDFKRPRPLGGSRWYSKLTFLPYQRARVFLLSKWILTFLNIFKKKSFKLRWPTNTRDILLDPPFPHVIFSDILSNPPSPLEAHVTMTFIEVYMKWEWTKLNETDLKWRFLSHI